MTPQQERADGCPYHECQLCLVCTMPSACRGVMAEQRRELVAKMLARLGGTSMEEALADVGRKLERWVNAAERLVRVSNAADVFGRPRGGVDVHEKREAADDLEAVTRELRYLVAP